MAQAHRKLVDEQGLNDAHFDAVAGHLQSTLQDLKVDEELIGAVITKVGGLRDQVLCRGEWATHD